MRRRIQWYYLYMAGAATVLFIVILIAFNNLRDLVAYADRLKETNKLLFRTEALISNLKDAESAQRGFLITKKSFFLQPYFSAVAEKEKVTKELLELLERDEFRPKYEEKINNLIQLYEQRYAQLDTSRRLSWAITLENDTIINYLENGSWYMDEARKAAQEIQEEQSSKLFLDEHFMTSLTRETPINLFWLSLLALIFFAGTFMLVIREINIRYQYQHDLERKIEDLKQSNQELEQFAYVASHDLQEPLRKLRTFGDRLQQKYKKELPEEGQFMIERMQNSAGHMQKLIDDLLSFSRLISRGEELPFVPVDLKRTLDGVIDEYSDAIRHQSALVRIPPAIPKVTGRPTQLHQVFANLMSNSLKFSRPGKPPVIDVRHKIIRGRSIPGSRPGDAELEFCGIEFADNGVGFDMSYRDKIFTIFQRLHNKNEYKGSGIGLSICKKIVERHNGYIDAWSSPEKGTAFYIYLPLHKDPD